MKSKFILATIIVLVSFNTKAQKVTPTDLKLLEGSWVGTLTYLDYKTNQPYTMPSNTTFKQSKNNLNIYLRSISYSNEPKANQKDSMIISNDETMLDDYKIISNKKLQDDAIEIIGEKNGVDGNDNKPATIRRIFTISSNIFINQKQVMFNGTNNWIIRHTYRFRKQI